MREAQERKDDGLQLKMGSGVRVDGLKLLDASLLQGCDDWSVSNAISIQTRLATYLAPLVKNVGDEELAGLV